MAREVIGTTTTALYDQDGRLMGHLTDEYFIDRRDNVRHHVQQPTTAAPRLVTTQQQSPARRTPEQRLQAMSDEEKRTIALKALTVGTPPQPRTLERVVEIQRQRQQQS